MEEKWKDIIDYENLYEISNYGKIRSKEKGMLTTKLNKGGYNYIHLYKSTKLKSFLIHRLVALHFINNSDNKLFVNHLDGMKTNNYYNNLEWCTHNENMTHAKENNLMNSLKLKNNKNACKKLIDTSNGKVYNSINEASLDLNINRNYLGCMLNGRNKNKTTLTYI